LRRDAVRKKTDFPTNEKKRKSTTGGGGGFFGDTFRRGEQTKETSNSNNLKREQLVPQLDCWFRETRAEGRQGRLKKKGKGAAFLDEEG